MTNEISKAIEDISDFSIGLNKEVSNISLGYAISALEKQMNSGWIPIKTRPLTEEEKKEYAGYNYTDAYDCKMPDNEQEVLITTNYGTVEKTTYYTDYGCYFDGWEDDGEVIAWMPLPKPYN